MGKKTRSMLDERVATFNKVQDAINFRTKATKDRLNRQEPLIAAIPQKFLTSSIRQTSDFQLKTKSSNRDKQVLELVRHLFVQYPVPKILEQSWHGTQSANPRIDFKEWYICVASGGSLYKQHCKDMMTKKEVHSFLNCKLDLTLHQALFYSISVCAGVGDDIAYRIAKSKISEKQFNNFWKDCTRFFSKNIPESILQLNDLTDYLEAKYQEDRNFSIIGFGYNLNVLLKKMKDWHYALRRIKVLGNHVWEGFPIPNEDFSRENEHKQVITWRMKQIKSSKELAAEGNIMHHCVFSYKSNCIAGKHSIWSLSTVSPLGEEKKRVTIQLSKEGNILQARGFANRAVKNDEHYIIRQWSNKNGFRY